MSIEIMSLFDKLDRSILQLLQKNAALSVGDIAEQISVSKSACWRRIQKLQDEGVISKKVTLLDQAKINLPLTAYIVVRTNQHNENWAAKFKDNIAAIPEVLEVYRMSGDLDYLVKAVITDMDGYDHLYKKIIKVDLFDVSCSFVMETIKHTTEMPLNYLEQ
jgi:Lrp/AsnC family transcriptional regulator